MFQLAHRSPRNIGRLDLPLSTLCAIHLCPSPNIILEFLPSTDDSPDQLNKTVPVLFTVYRASPETCISWNRASAILDVRSHQSLWSSNAKTRANHHQTTQTEWHWTSATADGVV